MNANPKRTKISVCMAAYNGALYISAQIASILPQLGPRDELIIVDDSSTDETIGVIQGFNDPRIRLVQNDRNIGAIRSFERALHLATGEVIFLSDQDDVWREDKISIVMLEFDRNPNATLVATAVTVVDSDGNSIPTVPKPFRGGLFATLTRNNYQGCTLAFRRSVKDAALPFPADIPMHDSWIGLVNTLLGEVGYLDLPLVRYRRHLQNATGRRPLPLDQKIAHRWALCTNLVRRARLLAKRKQQQEQSAAPELQISTTNKAADRPAGVGR